MDKSEIVRASDLKMTVAEVRRRWPEAVEYVGLDGEALPLGDASVDHVLTTWTLCTIPDAGRALAEVRRVLRPGGALHYDMIAIGPDQIAFMKKAGMPLSQLTRATYKEVKPHARLAFDCVVDFVPGVEPYETASVVELAARGADTHLVLTIEAMHDERWTQMAVMGWESELGKLAQTLAKKSA